MIFFETSCGFIFPATEDCSENEDEAPIPTYPRNFNVGDLVWGKIRGFESWPGKTSPRERSEATSQQQNRRQVKSKPGTCLGLVYIGAKAKRRHRCQTGS